MQAEKTRLPYSTKVLKPIGGTALPWHCGQSGQPRPEPVRRTAAPVSTTAVRKNSATQVSLRNCWAAERGQTV